LGALFDELDRGLLIVEETMYIRKEDLYCAASSKEVGNFNHGYEVAAVRSTSGRSSPVNDKGAFLFDNDMFNDVFSENFLQLLFD